MRGRPRTTGACPEHLRSPEPNVIDSCAECRAVIRRRDTGHVAQHRQREMSAYRPLDEIIADPATRILRALRWFDWVSTADLLIAIEAPEYPIERQRYHNALHWLVAKRGVELTAKTYRITQLGRDLLRRTFEDYQHRLGEGVAA